MAKSRGGPESLAAAENKRLTEEVEKLRRTVGDQNTKLARFKQEILERFCAGHSKSKPAI